MRSDLSIEFGALLIDFSVLYYELILFWVGLDTKACIGDK